MKYQGVASLDFGCVNIAKQDIDRRFGHCLYRNLSRLRLSYRLILSDAIWKDYGTFVSKLSDSHINKPFYVH